MKLYKFRPLANCQDLLRAQEILDTGKFWCSHFWELNDPMEGVHLFNPQVNSGAAFKQIFDAKSHHVLCSFSGEAAFKNPLMWGYYANGFKGMAIEIEINVDAPDMVAVLYAKENPTSWEGEPLAKFVRRILATKLPCWQHEAEHRLIAHGTPGLRKAGSITAVYFGNPYATTVNAADVQDKDVHREYRRRVVELKRTGPQSISYQDITVDHGEVHVNGKPS